MKLISIKKLPELGITIIADENSRDLYYVTHIYDEGVEIDDSEKLYDVTSEIYDYFINY